jgi:hypothetical protein
VGVIADDVRGPVMPARSRVLRISRSAPWAVIPQPGIDAGDARAGVPCRDCEAEGGSRRRGGGRVPGGPSRGRAVAGGAGSAERLPHEGDDVAHIFDVSHEP